MKRKKIAWTVFYCAGVFFALVLLPFICHADTAEVLPTRVFNVGTTYYHYFDIKKRYNQDGKIEDLATDFNGELSSNVFPGLAVLDPYVGGTASIGRSVVDFKYIYNWWEFWLAYGITDRLTVGVLLPVNHSRNQVTAYVDSSTANVGKNPFINSLAPLYVPGTVPLTTNDVQQLVGRGLDINGDGKIDIPGLGYKPVKTWKETGIGDVELVGKYQLYNKKPWRFAAALGVRFPTGEVDDPDNLVDLGMGDGQYDILARLHLDYVGIKNLCLNGTIRYDYQLPDHRRLRIPEAVNRPITETQERVDRKLGDVIELEAMANYNFTSFLSGGVKYRFTYKQKDRVNGDMGFVYSSLEDETNLQGHMAFVFATFNTIQMYLDKKFPVPFAVNIAYRNRFAGKNNATRSQYIACSLDLFF